MLIRNTLILGGMVLLAAWIPASPANDAKAGSSFSGGDHDPALDVLTPLLGTWRVHEQLTPVENMAKQTYGTETVSWALGGKAMKVAYAAEGDGIQYESVAFITHDPKRDRFVMTIIDTMNRPHPVVGYGNYNGDKKEYIFEVPSLKNEDRLEQRIVIRIINPQLRERVTYQITAESDQKRIHARYQYTP